MAADHAAGRFLEIPAARDLSRRRTGPPAAAADAGQQIGPYRILRPLGAGGVGEVFLAARADDHYEHRVAIKILRQLVADDDPRSRLLAERQFLARLEHPNIARLYDGGTTEDGRPYLVMEYIDGLPIDAYCARHAPALEERLSLFQDLCSAVQFAHQRFVVHRDLKPSNVLVTTGGVLKLLDFSIAKAISPVPGPLGAHTATGKLPMTLSYASPEQIRGEAVTVATDVHGLGILLYLILTGRHPFPVGEEALHRVVEIVCTREPVPPSQAASEPPVEPVAGETAPLPGGLPPSVLAGDLDAIALKALEKRPGDRYASAEQMAADLERYRRRRPILARPHSLGYRLRKAASRHRTILVLAGLMSLLIAGFVLALVAQTRRAGAEARRASLEAERANREARSAEEVSGFLVGVFKVFDPSTGKGGTVTARELLDQSLRRAYLDLASQPASLGRILDTIGVAYHQLGLYDAAAETLEKTLEVRAHAHGEKSLEVAETLRHQAELSWATGDHARAERIYSRALDVARASPQPDELAVAASLHGLGIVSWIQGRFADAERYSREALEIRTAHLEDPPGPDHRLQPLQVADTTDNLAIVLHDLGRYDEAEALFFASITLRERHQRPSHPHFARVYNNLAALYSAQGRDGESERYLERAVDIWRESYGDDYPKLGGSWINLAILYVESLRLEKAETALAEAHRIIAATQGPDHPWAAMATHWSARLRLEQGRLGEARSLVDQAYASLERNLGPGHPIVAEAAETYGRVLNGLGDAESARGWLSKSHRILVEAFGPDHPDVVRMCERHPAVCPLERDAASSL